MGSKKTKRAAIIGLLLSFTIVTAGSVFAQGWGGHGRGMRGHGLGSGPNLELRTEIFNAEIGILAQLTGQSHDAIKSKLRFKPMWAVLDEYNVDYSDFDEKLTEKRTALIKKAVSDNKISQAQADYMLQRMRGR